jgi:hypothetical protein
MLLPLTAIAAVFLGAWVLAVAIEFRLRPRRKRKQKSDILLPKSDVSLISLLLFLFAPTRFTNPSHSLKFGSEFHRGADSSS